MGESEIQFKSLKWKKGVVEYDFGVLHTYRQPLTTFYSSKWFRKIWRRRIEEYINLREPMVKIQSCFT